MLTTAFVDLANMNENACCFLKKAALQLLHKQWHFITNNSEMLQMKCQIVFLYLPRAMEINNKGNVCSSSQPLQALTCLLVYWFGFLQLKSQILPSGDGAHHEQGE